MMIINRQCILLNIYYVTSYPNRDSSVCGCGRAAAAAGAAVADEEGFRDAGAWSETFMGIEWGGCKRAPCLPPPHPRALPLNWMVGTHFQKPDESAMKAFLQ